MQRNIKKEGEEKIRNKIDNIFSTSSLFSLPFDDYEEADEAERSNRLRKYVHIKTKEEYAFKVLHKEMIDDVKNKLIILTQLKILLNSMVLLVTDIKLTLTACDIANGLNFLNAVKMVHGDVSAVNIVITDHDTIKITNFKFVKFIEEGAIMNSVSKESIRYIAPEIVREGKGTKILPKNM
ncbi:hypothetical protein RclHR1_03400011 [Rhizophagus clarus]|uniref:Protein kinase domain-containing protein n=1 Tax=Rhizophagus clarus TaxID=94130 RepID=A0A2Z6RPK1_9GLOM|nr:hypothetical protein RclHR1_03400011 [Rhizophagus clarus]